MIVWILALLPWTHQYRVEQRFRGIDRRFQVTLQSAGAAAPGNRKNG